jgi:hypothetical protein
VSRDRDRMIIALMEHNARFYVEQATLAGRSATAIVQGDPPPGRSRHCYRAGRPTAWVRLPGCSRIGCKPIEVSMGPHGKRRRVWSPVAKPPMEARRAKERVAGAGVRRALGLDAAGDHLIRFTGATGH